MFKQVSLEVKSKNDLLAAAKMHGATLSITDCRPLDRERMIMFLDINGTPAAVKETIATLRKMTGVKKVYGAESDAQGTRVLAILTKPGVCRASMGEALLCLDCPYNSTEIPARWRFVAKRTSDVGQIIARLGEEGIQARIEDISPLDEKVKLTEKERGIIAIAIENGYFDFPRKITLEGLGRLVGVEPASLSKIFHSVE
jgi:predicted DNA binding protein